MVVNPAEASRSTAPASTFRCRNLILISTLVFRAGADQRGDVAHPRTNPAKCGGAEEQVSHKGPQPSPQWYPYQLVWKLVYESAFRVSSSSALSCIQGLLSVLCARQRGDQCWG